MRTVAGLVDRTSAAACRLSGLSVIVMAVAMTLIISLQVVMRYVFNVALNWSEEVAIALFTWIVLLAGSMGVREGFHVRISLLSDVLPGIGQAGLARLIDLVVFLVGVALLVAGYAYVRDTAGQISAAIGFRIELLHLAAPVFGALVALHALASLLQPFSASKGQRQDPGLPPIARGTRAE